MCTFLFFSKKIKSLKSTILTSYKVFHIEIGKKQGCKITKPEKNFFIFVAIFCALRLQAQSLPILTDLTSDQTAQGTAKLPGLAINFGLGPTLTFFDSNFSNIAAHFATIDLKGIKGTLDLPLDEIFADGEQDSDKIKIDPFESRVQVTLP